jgi:type II secretory pathway predicted ATPase ExeA
MHQKPFADDAAGLEYFASEAHYRLLAANIRDQLQQHGGCVVLTGDPAPNSDLLLRQLTVVGSPRCRATIIKCQAQMTVASLMDNYRRLVGSTIESVTRRVASWSTPSIQAARGQEIDILVLDNVESLGDEVLRQLCCPPTDTREYWPPRLLVAGKALVERLAADALESVGSTIGARYHLDRLVQREVSSFIRYQLTAADLDQLDIFKPQVIELIEIYADGDPVVVNGLARRILKIVPELAAKRLKVSKQAKEADHGTDTVPPAITTASPPLAKPAAPDEAAPPEPVASPILSIPEPIPAQMPAPSRLPESVSVAVEPPPAVVLPPVLDVREESAPAEAEPLIAQAPEPMLALAEPPAAPSPEPVLTVREESAPAEAKPPTAPVPEPMPAPVEPTTTIPQPRPVSMVQAENAPAEAEPVIAQLPEPAPAPVEPPAAVEAVPLIKTVLPPMQSSEPPRAPVATEPSIIQTFEPAPSPEAESTPSEVLPPELAAGSQFPSAAQENIPAEAQSPIVAVADAPATTVVEIEAGTSLSAANDREAPIIARPSNRRRVVALSLALASVIIAVAVTLGATLRRDGEGTYLDAAVKFVRGTSLFANATKMSTGLIGVSEPVPKDPGPQPLRTTSNDASQNLLIAAEPTVARDTNSAKTEQPAATARSIDVAPAPPAPPKPSAPVAANPPPPTPPPPPSEPAVVAVAAPPASVRAPPSPPPVAPVKHEAPELSPPKVAAAPAADRTLSSADIDLLLRHGDQLLASGDIVAARHYFELVAEAGDVRAALRLGKTYDPAFLQQNGVRGIAGDPVAAKSWYLKAIASGDKEADMQLLRLMTLYPQ